MSSTRLHMIKDHLTAAAQASSQKSPDDVVVVMSVRSPMCKAHKGGFKDTTSTELLTSIMKMAKDNLPMDVRELDDIMVGTVHTVAPVYEARSASLAAGFPHTTTIQAVNRLCASGLMAVKAVSDSIKVGEIDVGLAVGFENMTANPRASFAKYADEIYAVPEASDSLKPVGWTSENVSRELNVSREDMDKFALISHTRAINAQESGRFNNEICRLEVWASKKEEGKVRARHTVTKDDGVRAGTTLEKLLSIKGAFPQWAPSNTTGGNASQVTDGGAAILLMRRSKAEKLGLKILAKHVGSATAGLEPRIMGIGPAFAIPKLLNRQGLQNEDIDLFEINEAFASMYVYCVRTLKLDIEKVNVNGGAIALGHPVGCTGVRQIVTGLEELRKRGKRTLVTSMCTGTGMGAAALFISEA